MIKEAIAYLVSLKDAKTFVIDGNTYSTEKLNLIDPPIDRPSQITVNSLDSIINLIKQEIDRINTHVYIRVITPTHIDVFTTYNADYSRYDLYQAKCTVPGFREGFMSYAEAMISLRSKYIENEGITYLVNLLSRITDENSVASKDNGATQTVETRKGIQLNSTEKINPRVRLIPYRTFLEVEQPGSEFLLRLDDKGNIGLFEADGGIWQIKAKNSIREYLCLALIELMEKSQITVMV